VLGTCASIFLIVAASTRYFLSVVVDTPKFDSRGYGSWEGHSDETFDGRPYGYLEGHSNKKFVGVFFPDDWVGNTTIVGFCDVDMGSCLLMLSLLLWIILVVTRKWIAPMHRADKDVAPEVATCSRGNVAEESPETLPERV
jgi:hypothetical protein